MSQLNVQLTAVQEESLLQGKAVSVGPSAALLVNGCSRTV